MYIGCSIGDRVVLAGASPVLGAVETRSLLVVLTGWMEDLGPR